MKQNLTAILSILTVLSVNVSSTLAAADDGFAILRAEFARYYRQIVGKDAPEDE